MFAKKKIIYFTVIILLFVAIFGAGFLFGRVRPYIAPAKNVDMSPFWDAYNKLQQNFVDPSKIDNQKIVYGAISGMTKSLGDPYTDFFDPAQAKIFAQDLSGSFGGIGIEVGIKKEQLTVIAPLKDTPAQKAGLKAGDMIVKIDGKDTADMAEEDAINKIRGKRGTDVNLTIFRDGWKNTKDFIITRDTISVPSIDWSLKDGDVAYIHIYEFGAPLVDNFQKIAFGIMKSPAKKIILDLRNNPGGYLEICQQLAGWFMKQGQIVAIEDFGKGKEQNLYKTDGNASLSNYPTVVLINEGSASASEILAGALRDNRGIKLIGEKSFGKGSVQTLVQLVDGLSSLKVTIAKWLTPKGNSISEIGLTPDVEVKMTDDNLFTDNDPQLQKALEIIKILK